MSDKPPIQFRIYKPQFDQGFEKCSIHRPPYAHYDLDPTYWEKFYEFIELSAYDKLKAENERLKSRGIEDLRWENERLRALNSDLKSGAICHICYDMMDEDSKNLALTREREAAKVMREAWRQSLELFTPNPGEELTEYGEGAKQTIEQMREQYEEALAKADEIRGGE